MLDVVYILIEALIVEWIKREQIQTLLPICSCWKNTDGATTSGIKCSLFTHKLFESWINIIEVKLDATHKRIKKSKLC